LKAKSRITIVTAASILLFALPISFIYITGSSPNNYYEIHWGEDTLFELTLLAIFAIFVAVILSSYDVKLVIQSMKSRKSPSLDS